MSTAPVSVDYATKREPIHHATAFGFGVPTTCGKTDTPKPAASEWRYVQCPRCLALVVHARRSADDVALCGELTRGRWTTRRSQVTCPSCVGEIEIRSRKAA